MGRAPGSITNKARLRWLTHTGKEMSLWLARTADPPSLLFRLRRATTELQKVCVTDYV
jgi:hypothetical protein